MPPTTGSSSDSPTVGVGVGAELGLQLAMQADMGRPFPRERGGYITHRSLEPQFSHLRVHWDPDASKHRFLGPLTPGVSDSVGLRTFTSREFLGAEMLGSGDPTLRTAAPGSVESNSPSQRSGRRDSPSTLNARAAVRQGKANICRAPGAWQAGAPTHFIFGTN